MFLLDTDHLVILQRRSEPEWIRLRDRMSQYQQRFFQLSIVSFHEQLLGANTFISRARSRAEVVCGYRMMENSLIDFSRYRVLPFNEPAAMEFENLRKQGIRTGTMDLRIAAIALSNDLTVLTRNVMDFKQVPNLKVEDWTVGK